MKTKRLLMLMFASAALFMVGCKKDTTYTFVDNYGMPSASDYSVILSEYDASGSRVMTNKLDDPTVGQKYVYTANEHSEKIKVKFQYKFGSTSYNKWAQQVWYLEEGKNIDIVTDGETIVGNQEP